MKKILPHFTSNMMIYMQNVFCTSKIKILRGSNLQKAKLLHNRAHDETNEKCLKKERGKKSKYVLPAHLKSIHRALKLLVLTHGQQLMC